MPFFPLLCLTLIHAMVDGYSQVVSPLWPRLKVDFGLSHSSLTFLFAAWTTAASVSQPLFGYWGDRFGSRWLLGVGPALAVASISLIGFANGPFTLGLLLVLGGLGIGAFHPEAVSGVAHSSRQKSSWALAIFIAGGMLGLGFGPMLSGWVVERHGLQYIAWGMAPSLFLLAVLLFLARPGTMQIQLTNGHVPLAEIFRGRAKSAALLSAVGALRTVPAIGIPLALTFLLAKKGWNEYEIGRLQSVFLISGGIGTLVCPLFVRPGRETSALVWMTLLPVGCLLLLTEAGSRWWGQMLPSDPRSFLGMALASHVVGMAVAGWFLQGAMPTLVGYSQRLLPRGRRLAASLVMGTSWGLGGIITAGLQAYFNAVDNMDGMLWAMMPFAAVAALGATLLPDVASLTDPSEAIEPTLAVVEPAGAVVQ